MTCAHGDAVKSGGFCAACNFEQYVRNSLTPGYVPPTSGTLDPNRVMTDADKHAQAVRLLRYAHDEIMRLRAARASLRETVEGMREKRGLCRDHDGDERVVHDAVCDKALIHNAALARVLAAMDGERV